MEFINLHVRFISVLQGLEGLELSEGTEQMWVKGTDVGRNCRESDVKKKF